MIQSAFHRTGDHSRVESCPSPRFASARRSGFPLLRASTRTPPFVRLLPLRYDREHDPIRKVGSSLTPAGRAGARSRPTATNRRGPQVTFTTQENDGQVCRRSGSRRPYCYGRAGERAVRVTTFPILADGFHRRHGPRAPSGGIRRSVRRTRAPTRHCLEHLLVTGCVRRSMESAPTRRTSRRHDRRFASREGHERANASRCFRSSITRSRA
jgi:hypothetical protein